LGVGDEFVNTVRSYPIPQAEACQEGVHHDPLPRGREKCPAMEVVF